MAFRGFYIGRENMGAPPEQINDYFFQEVVAKFIIWNACKKSVYSQEKFVGNTKVTITAYSIYVIKSLMDRESLDFNYPKIWEQPVSQCPLS